VTGARCAQNLNTPDLLLLGAAAILTFTFVKGIIFLIGFLVRFSISLLRKAPIPRESPRCSQCTWP